MPAYAIKGGGVLQLRENFADKRENHADTSLPARKAARMVEGRPEPTSVVQLPAMAVRDASGSRKAASSHGWPRRPRVRQYSACSVVKPTHERGSRKRAHGADGVHKGNCGPGCFATQAGWRRDPRRAAERRRSRCKQRQTPAMSCQSMKCRKHQEPACAQQIHGRHTTTCSWAGLSESSRVHRSQMAGRPTSPMQIAEAPRAARIWAARKSDRTGRLLAEEVGNGGRG